ncbi:thiamine diphosphokinase [Mesoplasma chauliocola]|uniref:Thiamine diphosphokinase n=1 Tax=Mesoplasma chauliocola TaxID=216427 RepID=A0A249SMY6_9MOLU|nr:thiamine diphosphokinase [Mesoplasma chauliocola]ASZ08980.1 thiamine diphosphokinase [Mesoplasma chauliocola]
MLKNIIIVTSKSNIDLSIFNNENNYIIGVERGCLDLIEKNIKIDLAISDFDQVLDKELELIKSKAIKFSKMSSEKDYLDGEIAILEAKKISDLANIIFIANATKRYDMNLSIINMIFKYENLKFINDSSVIFKINSGITELEFSDFKVYTYISLFSKVEATLSLKGLKYECKNLKLLPLENTCISNALVLNKNPIIETSEQLVLIATR